MKTFTLLAIAVAAAGATAQGDVVRTFADQDQFGDAVTLGSGFTATVQAAGVRPATSGSRFFNVEGRDNGDFASWGAIRFDLTALYADLAGKAQAAYGASGSFVIDGVTLITADSPASFSRAGAVEVYRAPNDTLSVDPRSPGAGLGFGTTLGGNRMYNGSLGTVSSVIGTMTYATSFSTDISEVLSMGELNGVDNFLTLVIDANDRAVAFTIKGQDSPFAGVNAPALDVSYTLVPAPASTALIAAAGLIAGRRRRA